MTFELLLKNELSDCEILLNIGCGKASPIKYALERPYSVGIDGYKPYLQKSKKARLHDDYFLGDVNHLCFSPKSFQTVVLLDVLEQLGKNCGLQDCVSNGKIGYRQSHCVYS